MPDLSVVKYGGSVLTGPEAFRAAASYALGKTRGNGKVVVVPSAMSGLTNRFGRIYDAEDEKELLVVRDTVYRPVAKALPRQFHDEAMDRITDDMKRAQTFLEAGNRDAFVGSPEGHSAILENYHLIAQGGDAEYIFGPDAGFRINDHGLIDMEASRELLRVNVGGILSRGRIAVASGFLGRHYRRPREYKLAGRDSNDACAVALGDALDGGVVEIIKNVPGVFRVTPGFGDYGLLRKLSYDESGRMTRRGPAVVHPSAIQIARAKGMPLIVKDIDSIGTLISDESETTDERFVAALVAERVYEVIVQDPLIDTPEGVDYPSTMAQFQKGCGANGFTPPVADSGWISYRVIVGDRKNPADTAALFMEHLEKLTGYLHEKGYRPTVQGQGVGVITVVGDRMRGRQNTFSYLAGLLGKKGISVLFALQGNEQVIPSTSITLEVDPDKLESSVEALTAELFAVR
ncbi:MAG: aspartate kinase [Candidatus Aenigmarchaeota archaeon]|nr:aspartate kinase [Candidatus Aenigmarchaeota archaeon]